MNAADTPRPSEHPSGSPLDRPSDQPAGLTLANLVVAVDNSPESVHALDMAAALGAPHRATITIVHVRAQPPALSFSPAAIDEFKELEAEMTAAITATAVEHLADYPGAWSVVARRGQVSSELLAAADEVDADMVVVGHRSHGPIRDAILGSVASGTVHRTRRTMLIAIPPSAHRPS